MNHPNVSDVAEDTTRLSILTYNLWMHAAYKDAFRIATQYGCDVICLQECYSDKLDDRVGVYELADKSRTGHMGVALYYNSEKLQPLSTLTQRLRISMYERLHSWDWERIVTTLFRDVQSNTKVVVASFHATHLVASNRLRRQQIDQALQIVNAQVQTFDHPVPIILAGDYNYPLLRKGLSRFIARRGYTLHMPSAETYKNGRYHGIFDLVSTRNVQDVKLTVLPQANSDHMPLLAETNLGNHSG